MIINFFESMNFVAHHRLENAHADLQGEVVIKPYIDKE